MIQPRKPVRVPELPVLAVCDLEGECMFAGELFPIAELPVRLAERPPGRADIEQIPASVVVTDDPGALLARLDASYGRQGAQNFMLWQWSLSLRPATVWLAGETTAYEALSPTVSWFGWAARRGTFHRKGGARRFLALDAFAWTGATEILERYPGTLTAQLYRFGSDVQAFCREHGMVPCMSPAAIAGQFLRDARFWPGKDRRKVPHATNERARASLPGNYYRLLGLTTAGRAGRTHDRVLELDQRSAHNTIAVTQPFPASETLHAWGRFYTDPKQLTLADVVADVGRVAGEHGLFLAAVRGAASEPTSITDPLVLPAVAHRGVKTRHVWSNELDLIRDCGGTVVGVFAGWSSPDIDEGLNRYAWCALEQLQAADPARKGWLKQALLATYGLLAGKPREFTQLTKWGEGESMAVTTRAGHTFHGRVKRTPETEAQTCNVIWRGLIESQQRAETVSYARELRAAGHRVLSLYADAIYVDARDGNPPARAGWRVTQELTRVQFTSPTSFVSDQVTKQPGIARESRVA